MTLRYYCIHAYRSLSHASIMVYLAGVRHSHLERGYPDPTVDLPLLNYLCKGIRRHQGTSSSRAVKKPITTQILLDLQQNLSQNHSLPSRNKKLRERERERVTEREREKKNVPSLSHQLFFSPLDHHGPLS